MIYQKFIKPVLDIEMAFVLLLLFSPFLIIVIVILIFSNKGTPFFFQIRAGFRGESFRIIKFKTMNDMKDCDGKLLPDSERLTKIGMFLRKKSIDELLQLVNVIKGDISIVGPRPLLPQYLPHYNKKQARRHDVKPGITGWAQVHGRQTISFEDRFELDVWYVDNISFITDIRILIKTFFNVLKSKGVIENEGYWKI